MGCRDSGRLEKSSSKARQQLGILNIEIDPNAIGDLTVVEREIVEIAKVVTGDAKIVVMDEPTAALTPNEVDLLFQIVNGLRKQGVGIIYISHRLDEIFRIAAACDCVARWPQGGHVPGCRRDTTATWCG